MSVDLSQKCPACGRRGGYHNPGCRAARPCDQCVRERALAGMSPPPPNGGKHEVIRQFGGDKRRMIVYLCDEHMRANGLAHPETRKAVDIGDGEWVGKDAQ